MAETTQANADVVPGEPLRRQNDENGDVVSRGRRVRH